MIFEYGMRLSKCHSGQVCCIIHLPAYLGQAPSFPWLDREQTYGVLGKRQKYHGYQHYVEQGIGEELEKFCNKGNRAAVLGDKLFRQQALKKNKAALPLQYKKKTLPRPRAEQVITAIIFGVVESTIIRPQKGREKRNLPRKVAMYLCQRLVDMRLQEIASTFEIGHIGGVSNSLTEIRKLCMSDKILEKKIKSIMTMIQ